MLLLENFENESVEYVVTPPDDLTELAINDYHGRVDVLSLPSSVNYSNVQGGSVFAVQDTDAASAAADVITLEFSGIDILGKINIEFSLFVAEDDATDGNEDWDSNSSFLVEYSVDGADYARLFAIESEIGGDGNQTNERPRVDTDLDGTGDGAEITDVFTRYTAVIPDFGQTLDLRLSFRNLDSADEDFAIDQVEVSATEGLPGCSLADLAPPFGVLDFSDVLTFLTAYGAGCP